MSETEAENRLLRSEIVFLKDKIKRLETRLALKQDVIDKTQRLIEELERAQ